LRFISEESSLPILDLPEPMGPTKKIFMKIFLPLELTNYFTVKKT
jgi:hypothetical protein